MPAGSGSPSQGMASATLASPGSAPRPLALTGHPRPLRYANAEDLPSYPSPGLRPGDAAASAAATLGWASTPASPALAAASQPGTPRSQDALLAAGWVQRRQKQQPSLPSPWVSAAANLAFRASKTPPLATERHGISGQNPTHAAKGAMAVPRPRSTSSPQTSEAEWPRQSKTGTDALSAATIAHNKPSVHAGTNSVREAGAVPYTTMGRQMFTSNPPVKPETDEKKHADVLRASALAMAKKMYNEQQKIIDSPAQAHVRSSSFPDPDPASLPSSQGEEGTPVVFGSLQETAYRLAQERLAKAQKEHDREGDLQEYYGSPGTLQRSKFGTIKGKLTRRRSSSDGDLLEDRRRSEQIRSQMSLLRNKLTEVDEDKRMRDREALLAAAQRNVRSQLQELDAKVQSETGRVRQVTMDDWGRKALVAAQARFDAAGHENAGKVDIGGGKFMDRSEVEMIAAKKLQPLLDEINDRAEKENERREEERLAEERRKEEAERDRLREMEIQEIHKKLKDQQREAERAKKAEIKQEEKIRKDAAKAMKVDQRQAGTENEALPPATAANAQAEDADRPPLEPENKRLSTVGRVRALSINFSKRPPRQKGTEPADVPPIPDGSLTSPPRKVRNWLLFRFPRPRAKSASAVSVGGDQEPDSSNTEKSFIGGVALARLQKKNDNPGAAQTTEKRKSKEQEQDPMRPDSSMRELALAGRPAAAPRGGEPGESSSSKITKTITTATIPRAAIIPSTPPQRPVSQASQEASIPASVSPRQSVSSLASSLGDGSAKSISILSGSGSGSGGDICSEEDEEEEKEEEEYEETFVEARSEPEATSGSVSASGPASSSSKNLTPPRARGFMGGAGNAGRASPFRESRFSEILD